MTAYPKTCVIGAGSSGMVALKKLRDAGIPVDCFEKSDRVGGNWVIRNKNGLAAAYKSLHIDSSVRRTQFADYPMPDDYLIGAASRDPQIVVSEGQQTAAADERIRHGQKQR